MPRYVDTCTIHAPYRSSSTQDPFQNSRLSHKYRDFTDSFPSFKSASDAFPTSDRSPLQKRRSVEKKPPLAAELIVDFRHPGPVQPYGKFRHPRASQPAERVTTRWPGEADLPLPDELLASTSRVEIADELRWRNALKIYHELDLWNQGYIDIQDTAERLGSAPRTNLTHLERLVSILEDLKPHVSSRGVVEKDVAVQAIKRAIDESGLTNPVYRPLRGGITFSLQESEMQKEKTSQGIGLSGCSFYQAADFPLEKMSERFPHGAMDESWDISPAALCRPSLTGGSRKRPAAISENGWGPIDAGLEVHGRITKERRERAVEKLKREQQEKEEQEMKRLKLEAKIAKKPFKPANVSRTDYEPNEESKTDRELGEAVEIVAPKFIRFRAEEKSEGDAENVARAEEPLEFQRYRASRRIAEGQLSTTPWSHFVLHPGEPPTLAVPWEESLRNDWERIICNTQTPAKKIKPVIPQFGPSSKKIDRPPAAGELKRATPKLPPKVAFKDVRKHRQKEHRNVREEERRETAKILASDAFLPGPQGFSAPYQLIKSKDTKQIKNVCQEEEVEDEERDKRKRLLVFPIGVKDALLLPKRERGEKSFYNEIAEGMTHPNRGAASDWICNLRK